MKVPLLKTVAVGEFSSWARNFLNVIEEKEIIELQMEPSIDQFCRSLVPAIRPAVVLIENNPEAKKGIQKICSTGKPLYIIWVGKSFSKEDLTFAFDQRVYCLFESIQAPEKEVISKLRNLAQLVESDAQFQQILRAMKSILLQTEAELPNIPMVHELRTAVKKLENHGLKNELNHLSSQKSASSQENIFQKNQSLGDAIIIINELERTGTLSVRGSTAENEGKIEFIQGKITMASAGGSEGIKAILRMFLWDSCRMLFFRKDPREAVINKHIDLDIMHLSKLGSVYKDKFEKLRKEIPAPNMKLEFDPAALDTSTALTSNEFSTLSSVVEYGTVATIVDFNPLPDVEVYESLISLRKNRLIKKAAV